MKRIFLRLKQPLRNERGEITFFACFFVVGIVMLISFLLLYLKQGGYGIREIARTQKVPMRRIKELLGEVHDVLLDICYE